jgi:uncharacterized protein YbjT (DUF2867 family)
MNVLVTGASGYIGQNLIKGLIHTEHNLTACINKKELAFKVKVLKLDFTEMLQSSDWLPYLIGIDIVINCVGVIHENKKNSFDVMHTKAPIALFKACEKIKVKRVIQVSALGADDFAIVSYQKSKKQADDYLRSSRLEWFVLRPSLVYGSGGKSFNFFQQLSKLPIIPLFGNGEQLIQPVNIDVLIKTIKTCLLTKNTNQTIDVVGEQPISFKNWMKKLRKNQSKPRFVMLPIVLIKFFAQLLRPLNLQLFSEDNLTMLQQNNVGDYLPLKAFLENKA